MDLRISDPFQSFPCLLRAVWAGIEAVAWAGGR